MGVATDSLALSTFDAALSHRSYVNENRSVAAVDNEKLEFLGDAVVGLVVSKHLFLNFPSAAEGDLSKLKSVLVSKTVLGQAAEAVDLGRYLLLGKGEEAAGGRRRPSLLANAFEALLGAVYLEAGIEEASKVVLRLLSGQLEAVLQQEKGRDYKTELQEVFQRRYKVAPIYRVVGESGPDHLKRFEVQVGLGEELLGTGTGGSKKEAEQSAAQEALENLAARSTPVTAS